MYFDQYIGCNFQLKIHRYFTGILQTVISNFSNNIFQFTIYSHFLFMYIIISRPIKFIRNSCILVPFYYRPELIDRKKTIIYVPISLLFTRDSSLYFRLYNYIKINEHYYFLLMTYQLLLFCTFFIDIFDN